MISGILRIELLKNAYWCANNENFAKAKALVEGEGVSNSTIHGRERVDVRLWD